MDIMPEVCCRHCGRKLSSINVKTCPNPMCKKRLYKGDIVNCELLKKGKKEKSQFERMDERAGKVVGSADRRRFI
jgi:hypothetical protein